MPADVGAAVRALSAFVEAARAEGRDALLETEGLAVAHALGVGVPAFRLVQTPADVRRVNFGAFPGDSVVLKVVSAEILHKSDVGGVRFLPKDPDKVAAAVGEMSARLAGRGVAGFTVNEFVPHDPSLGGQLLLGMRWTADFGPVVTFGPGGVDAEFLARNLRPGRDTAILSPLFGSDDRIDAALEATAITPAATGRLRGQASRFGREDLRRLLARWLAFAATAMPDPVAEFEINPLVWSARGPTALDALVKLGGPRPPRAPPRPLERLANLLAPRSLAIVGVSDRENPGRTILRNTLAAGFPREALTVVKPGRSRLDGCRCVPDVASLPEGVDLLVVAVDAVQAAEVVDEAVRTGRARSLILISGGLGERAGREAPAERLEATIRAARRAPGGGPVVNGGNCLGIRSVPGRYDTLFLPRHKLPWTGAEAAPLAVVSQSGAFAVARSSKLWSLNPRYVVTIGNQMDLTVGDYLRGLAAEEDLRVFACYVEGFREGDGERWVETAASLAAAGKAVVLYRAGRTPAGARATASHTASIAGDYAVTRALATAAGALVAETHEDFEDLVRLACRLDGRPVPGFALGMLSNAGFECVTAADNLGPFVLAPFAPATVRRLEGLLAAARLEAIVGVQNPLDVTPILGDEAFEAAARAIVGDPGVDVGVVGCVPLSGALATVAAAEGHGEDLGRSGAIGPRLAGLFAASGKPWVAVVDAGPLYDPFAHLLEARGVPVFRTADRALRLLGTWAAWRHARGAGSARP